MSKSSSRSTSNEDGISASALKLRLLKKLRCTLKFEKRAWAAGAEHVAGVDEVGRGSLFGPVVAAAVILYQNDDPALPHSRPARFQTASRRAPRRTRASDSPAFHRLGRCRSGFRPHRSNQYLPGFAPRDASCRAATGAGGGLSSGRCGPARLRTSPATRSFTATRSRPPSPPPPSLRRSNGTA